MAALDREIGYSNPSLGTFWGVTDDEPAPELQWPNSIEIYDSMRRQDSQVISVLRAVTLPIRRTSWRIDSNGASPEVVEFISKNLNLPVAGVASPVGQRTRDRFSWHEHLRHALLMLVFGHSFFEQTYRFDGRRWELRKLGWRPSRTITRIDVAADGGLVAIEQAGRDGKDARIDIDRLVAYVNEREGGNWLGQSLLRPAYKFWLLKDRMLRVGAQAIDRNGMGIPVYTGAEQPDNLPAEEIERRQKDDLDAGRKIAQSFRSGNRSGAAIPAGAKLQLLGVDGTLPDAMDPIRYYDEQIARAVLAHFLNLGTETGSWALGTTFADFFTLSLQTVATQIADIATQHIVEDLVDLNFGEDVPAPRITFDEIGSRHPATAEAIYQLVNCGAIVPDDDLEEFIRTTYGMPSRSPETARGRKEVAPNGSDQTEQ